jgi:hypothetical protein
VRRAWDVYSQLGRLNVGHSRGTAMLAGLLPVYPCVFPNHAGAACRWPTHVVQPCLLVSYQSTPACFQIIRGQPADKFSSRTRRLGAGSAVNMAAATGAVAAWCDTSQEGLVVGRLLE